jgi:hypothetical protein
MTLYDGMLLVGIVEAFKLEARSSLGLRYNWLNLDLYIFPIFHSNFIFAHYFYYF